MIVKEEGTTITKAGRLVDDITVARTFTTQISKRKPDYIVKSA